MITRGQRNNNPFNIKYVESNLWKGKIPLDKKKDFTFEEFIDITFGIRAGYLLLAKYIRDGDDTVRKIINRWAPPSDCNDTEAYIKYVNDTLCLPRYYDYPDLDFCVKIDVDTPISQFGHFFIELGLCMMYYESKYLTTLDAVNNILISFQIL